jgi:serine/threonine protein kinase
VRREKAAKLLPSTRDGEPMHSPLASVLLAAREFSAAPKRSYFIPRDAIDFCLTKDAITAEIVRLGIDTSFSLEEMADCILYKYRKIFGILTMMNKGGEIEKFLFHHLPDAKLPLRIPDSAEIRRPLQPELAIFESWSDSDIRSFSSTQWSFLAPFFRRGTQSKISHYNLESKIVLPFLEDKDLSEPRPGGFSTVFRVQIHPDHYNFDSPHGNNRSFAIKCLKSSNDRDFEQEVSILQSFSHDHAHDHIIKLLASYTFRSKNHLLFHWADKDLRRYWEDSEQPPKLTSVMMEWSLRQMRGLASGLDAIHNYPISMVDQVESTIRLTPSRNRRRASSGVEWRHGRHGDLKPENILWFSRGSKNDMGVFKISDFGTASSRNPWSQGEITTRPCGTLTYEPPDRWLGSEISQSYDLWSLGCVFLEFITWMLMGSEGGDLFRDARMESETAIDSFNGLGTENFFTLDGGTSGVLKSARLKDGVRLWMADLRGHSNCSYALRDLLLVIESELLVPEAQKRATSGTLMRLLDQIIQKGAASEQYRVADTALQLRPPPTSKKRDFPSTNLKTWSPDIKKARLDLIKCNWSLPLPRNPHEDEDHEHHF